MNGHCEAMEAVEGLHEEIQSLKAQLKREQAMVDLIQFTSNETRCGMISMALLKEAARETVKARTNEKGVSE